MLGSPSKGPSLHLALRVLQRAKLGRDSAPDGGRLAHVLEAGEVGPVGPGERAAELLAGADGRVVDDVDQALVVGRALREALRLGTVDDLDVFDGGPFDAVLTVNSFGFWPDQEDALTALRQAMRPGGRIALGTQPRGSGATEAAALAAGEGLADLLRDTGFSEVRLEMLDLRPVPVAAALGVRP